MDTLKITYLGHAGFMIELPTAIVLMDPWLSEGGAYDYAWFQYPCNHHLADVVRTKVQEAKRENKQFLIYISHEHRDHWDPDFLDTLPPPDRLLLPEFARTFFKERYPNAYFFKDGERFSLDSQSYLEFYIHDSVREADSAVLLSHGTKNFLNLNDCHIHDRIAEITKRNGPIWILTGHFSGASWFPSCYSYCGNVMPKKSKRVKYGRFKTLAKVIEDTKPAYYIPSAGPACFLGENINKSFHETFPQASEFREFLFKRKSLNDTVFAYHEPGDVLLERWRDLPTKTRNELERELRAYRKRMTPLWSDRRRERHMGYGTGFGWKDGLMSLMREKLAAFSLADQVSFDKLVLTYKSPIDFIVVDFRTQEVGKQEISSGQNIWQHFEGEKLYVMAADHRDWQDLVYHVLTWYEFLLTLRVTLSREPDEFDPLLDGFLVNEPEELPAFCAHYLQRQDDERIVVKTDTKAYKVCRKCPHEGADLANGWVDGHHLVCPKHNWRFDLENGGKCDIHNSTIHAEEVTDEQDSSS